MISVQKCENPAKEFKKGLTITVTPKFIIKKREY